MPGDLFEKGGDVNATLPTKFKANTAGYSLSAGLDGNSVGSDLGRKGTFAQKAFDTRVPRILSDIDAVRAQVDPVTGQLMKSRLAAVENARSRSVGNLRDSLARRRVAGSSFANAQEIAANREFDELSDAVRAQSGLERIQLTMNALNEEEALLLEGINREFAELGLAAGFATQVGQIINANQQFQRQLAAEEASGFGQFAGTLVGAGSRLGTSFISAPAGGGA